MGTSTRSRNREENRLGDRLSISIDERRHSAGEYLLYKKYKCDAEFEKMYAMEGWKITMESEISLETTCEPARDPQDLERFLVSRQRMGDVDGMVSLYESDAVLDCGNGQLLRGKEAIREFYVQIVSTGRKFELGDQRPALISGDLALTSTRSADGSVTAEVAHRQSDGTWLWVIDHFRIA